MAASESDLSSSSSFCLQALALHCVMTSLPKFALDWISCCFFPLPRSFSFLSGFFALGAPRIGLHCKKHFIRIELNYPFIESVTTERSKTMSKYHNISYKISLLLMSKGQP